MPTPAARRVAPDPCPSARRAACTGVLALLVPLAPAHAQGILGRIKAEAKRRSGLEQVTQTRDAIRGMQAYREAQAALARTPSLVGGTWRITLADGADSVVFFARTLTHGRVPLAVSEQDPTVTREARPEDVRYDGGYLLNAVVAPALADLPATWEELRQAGGRPKGNGFFVVAYRRADAAAVAAYRGLGLFALEPGQSPAFDRLAARRPELRRGVARADSAGAAGAAGAPSAGAPPTVDGLPTNLAAYPGTFRFATASPATAADSLALVFEQPASRPGAGGLAVRAVRIAGDAYHP